MGHIGEHNMDELRKRGLINGVQHSKLSFCEECVIGEHKANAILEYVHTIV